MPERTAVRAITLDVGNTLLFPHPSLGSVYADVGRRHGLAIDAQDVEPRFDACWRVCQAQQTGLIYGTTHDHALEFWCAVNRAVLAERVPAEAALRDFVADLYFTFGRAGSWRTHPGLAELLAACRSRGIPIGIISNWDLRLRPLLDELGFTRWADPVLISAEIGLEKPAPALFHHALRALAEPASSVLHLGDTWADDVLGATACGMQAAWLNPTARPLPQSLPGVHDVRTLADAVSLLGDRL
jgi:putative hydrolase of the HAD superfamily